MISGKPVKSSIGRAARPAPVELARRAAGGDELDAELVQATRELDDARSCRRPTAAPGRRAPRPARVLHLAGHVGRRVEVAGHRPEPTRATRIRRGLSGSTLRAPRANRRTASGSRRARAGAGRPGRRPASRASVSSTPPCRITGAGVHASVDEVDRDTEHLHPVGERLLDRVQAGEGGQQRGMDVDDRAGSREEGVAEELHVAGEHDQARPRSRIQSASAASRAARSG